MGYLIASNVWLKIHIPLLSLSLNKLKSQHKQILCLLSESMARNNVQWSDFRTDRQSEASNKCIETYLHCFCSKQPKNWVPLGRVLIHTSHQDFAGMNPFEVMYGRKLPNLIRFLPRETVVAAVSQALIDRDELLRRLMFNLYRAQHHMIKYAIKRAGRRYCVFKVVLQRHNSVCTRVFQKQAASYNGPLKIFMRVRPVAFQLCSTHSHNIFFCELSTNIRH